MFSVVLWLTRVLMSSEAHWPYTDQPYTRFQLSLAIVVRTQCLTMIQKWGNPHWGQSRDSNRDSEIVVMQMRNTAAVWEPIRLGRLERSYILNWITSLSGHIQKDFAFWCLILPVMKMERQEWFEKKKNRQIVSPIVARLVGELCLRAQSGLKESFLCIELGSQFV